MFKVTKVSDDGTSNPTIARLGPGVQELVGFSRLKKEDQLRVLKCTIDVMHMLAPAQHLARTVIQELEEVETRVRSQGISFQSGGRVVDVPSAMNLDKAADFIIRSKKVLARAIDLIGLFWEMEFKGARYDRALKWALSALGPEHSLTRLLRQDQPWIAHLIALRNGEEHPKQGPFLRNYDVIVHQDGGVELVPPKFFDGTDVRSALTVFSEDMLTFVEELVVVGVSSTFISPGLAVAEIPPGERNPLCPQRFRVVLATGFPPPPSP
jgi:hypothetical protein